MRMICMNVERVTARVALFGRHTSLLLDTRRVKLRRRLYAGRRGFAEVSSLPRWVMQMFRRRTTILRALKPGPVLLVCAADLRCVEVLACGFC